ncbi:MAG: sialidase family protein [Armatimonadota bacterium]
MPIKRRVSVSLAAFGLLTLGGLTSSSSFLYAGASAPVPGSAPPPAPVAVIRADAPAFKEAREPQVAVGDNNRVYIAFGAGDTLYCAVSQDGGKSYASPVKVGQAGSLSLGMRRGPRIAITKDAVVVSAIYRREEGKGGHEPNGHDANGHEGKGHQPKGHEANGHDGELVSWRSLDAGKTWQGPTMVSDVPGAAREGLHAMAAAPDGKTLACTWLDLRNKGTEIFVSLSRDGGKTWGKNTQVYQSPDGTVCECCHPSLAFGPKNELLVMWRNALGGARDMYLARSTNGGSTFGPAQKLGSGTWPLKACPMDGGALAVAPNGAVTTVWRRDQDVFTCAPGGSETLLGRGQQAWTAATARGVYSVWLVGRPGRLMAQLPGEKAARLLSPQANDPAVASHVSGRGPVVVTWLEGPKENSRIQSAVFESSVR